MATNPTDVTFIDPVDKSTVRRKSSGEFSQIDQLKDIFEKLRKIIYEIEAGPDGFNAMGPSLDSTFTTTSTATTGSMTMQVDRGLGAQQLRVSIISTMIDSLLIPNSVHYTPLLEFKAKILDESLIKNNADVTSYFSEEWQVLLHYIYLLETIYSAHADSLYLELIPLKNVGGPGAYGLGSMNMSAMEVLKSNILPPSIVSIKVTSTKDYLKDGTYQNILKSRHIEPFYMTPELADKLLTGYTLETPPHTREMPPMFADHHINVFDGTGTKKYYAAQGGVAHNAIIFMLSFSKAPSKWLENAMDNEDEFITLGEDIGAGPADSHLDVILWKDAASRDDPVNRQAIRKIITTILANGRKNMSTLDVDDYVMSVESRKEFELFIDTYFVELTLEEATTPPPNGKFFINGTWFTDTPLYLHTWANANTPGSPNSGKFWTTTNYDYLRKTSLFDKFFIGTKSLRQLANDAGNYPTIGERREKFVEFINSWHLLDKPNSIRALQSLIVDHFKNNRSAFADLISFGELRNLVLDYSLHNISPTHPLYVLDSYYNMQSITLITPTAKIEIATQDSIGQDLSGQIQSIENSEVTINVTDSLTVSKVPGSESISPIIDQNEIETSDKDILPFKGLLVMSTISAANSGIVYEVLDRFGTIWNQGETAITFAIKDSKGSLDPGKLGLKGLKYATIFPFFDENGNSFPYSKNYATMTWIEETKSLYFITHDEYGLTQFDYHAVASITLEDSSFTDEQVPQWRVVFEAYEATGAHVFDLYGGQLLVFNIPNIPQGALITDRVQLGITSVPSYPEKVKSKLFIQETEPVTLMTIPVTQKFDVEYDLWGGDGFKNPDGSTPVVMDPSWFEDKDTEEEALDDGGGTISPSITTTFSIGSKEVPIDEYLRVLEKIQFNKPSVATDISDIIQYNTETGESLTRSTSLPAKALQTDSQFKYVRPANPEDTGVMYIGDILFHIPPVNLRFSTVNQTMSIPTMRTKGDPINTSNNNIPKVDITVYFKGTEQINNTLRPLLALSQVMPTTSVQNTTIFDSWIGRRDKLSDSTLDEIDRFLPLPCYLESINVGTIPGFPNTLQAHITLIQMDISPMVPVLTYWKYTSDALNQAMMKTTRQSISNTILTIKDKETPGLTKNPKNDSEIKVLNSVGQLLTIKLPDKMDQVDDDKITVYPQESFPFRKLYRNRLLEEENTFSRVVKDPFLHWNKYLPAENSTLYLTYKSPRYFNDEWYSFKSRFDLLAQNMNGVRLLFQITGAGLTEEASISNLFRKTEDFGLREAIEYMVGALSWVKDWDATISILNREWKKTVVGMARRFGSEPLMITFNNLDGTEETVNLADWVDSTSVDLEYVDEDGNIKQPVRDIINSLVKRFAEDLQPDKRAKNGNVLPASLDFVETIIQNILINPIFDEETPTNPLNYEDIQIGLGWSESPSVENIDLLVKQGLFPTMTKEGKKQRGKVVRYHFQSVIQSISWSYANNLSPMFLASSTLPTYQHMGTANAMVTISLRTRDERLIKILTDMKEAANAIGSQILSGNTELVGFDVISLSGAMDKVYSGHLLNSFGFKHCSIASMEHRNMEGFPGWWEVNIDLIENNTVLRSWENLSLVPSIGSNTINILKKALFAIPFVVDSGAEFDPTLAGLQGTGKEITIKKDIGGKKTYNNRTRSVTTAKNVVTIKTTIPEKPPSEKLNFDEIALQELPLESIIDHLVRRVVHVRTGKNYAKVTLKEVERSGTIKATYKEWTINFDKDGNELKGRYSKDEIARVEEKWAWKVFQSKRKPSYKGNVVLDHSKALGPWLEKLADITKLFSEYDKYLKGADVNYPQYTNEAQGLPDRQIAFGLQAAVEDAIGACIEMTCYLFDSAAYNLVERSYREVEDRIAKFIKMYPEAFSSSGTLPLREAIFSAVKYGPSLAKYDYSVQPSTTFFTKGLRYHIVKGFFIDPINASINLNTDALTIEAGMFSNTLSNKLTPLIRRQDFRELIDQQAEAFGFSSTNKPDLAALYAELNRSIAPNYPDLNLPDIYLTSTGTQLMSPTFCFVDIDPDLEIVEMEKSLVMLRTVFSTQIAALWGVINKRAYDDIQAYMVTNNGQNTPMFDTALNTMSALEIALAGKGERKRGLVIPAWLLDQTDPLAPRKDKLDIKNLKAANIFKIMGDLVKKIELEQTQNNENPDPLARTPLTVPLTEGYQGLAKSDLMKIMSLTALVDYVITLMAVAPYVTDQVEATKWLGATDGLNFVEASKALSKHVAGFLEEDKPNVEKLASIFKNTVLLTGIEDLKIDSEIRIKRTIDLILKKKNKASSMLTIASTGDWSAFNSFMGIGNVDGDFKRTELLTKFNEYMQTKRKGTMDRVYPAFKLFILEEDSPVWHSFDDFYTYDAASEISIIESKHAASKTALLKLSNVTGKLTGKKYNDLINEGYIPLPGANVNLKVGAEIMILLGYGADYRQLRMKFKGAITEINPGAILELTAQSWGAGLLNQVGSLGGIEHTTLNGASTLGGVLLDILTQTPGLGKLGRWGLRDWDKNDPKHFTYTSLKRIYYARAMNSALGWIPSKDFAVVSNISDILGGFLEDRSEGLPFTGKGVLEKYRQNDVIVRSVGNAIFDNIIINNNKLDGYGLFQWVSRVTKISSWGFSWHIYAQSAWDALHEVTLFLGDYIVTTLPFDEGNDVFSNPPRETLYVGPREHLYNASSFKPTFNIRDIMAEIIKDYNNSSTIVANATELAKDFSTNLDNALAKLKELEDGAEFPVGEPQVANVPMYCTEWYDGHEEDPATSPGDEYTVLYTIPTPYDVGASGATFTFFVPEKDSLDKDQASNLINPGSPYPAVHVLGDFVKDHGIPGWGGMIEVTRVKATDRVTGQQFNAEVEYTNVGDGSTAGWWVTVKDLPEVGATFSQTVSEEYSDIEIFGASGNYYEWNAAPFSSAGSTGSNGFNPEHYIGRGKVLLSTPGNKPIQDGSLDVFLITCNSGGPECEEQIFEVGTLGYTGSGGATGFQVISTVDILGPTYAGSTQTFPHGTREYIERSYILEIYDTPSIFLYDEKSSDVTGASYDYELRAPINSDSTSFSYQTKYKVATKSLDLGCSYARESHNEDVGAGTYSGWEYDIYPEGDLLLEIPNCRPVSGDCPWLDEAEPPGMDQYGPHIEISEEDYGLIIEDKAFLKIPRSPWFNQYIADAFPAQSSTYSWHVPNLDPDPDERVWLSRCGVAISNDWLDYNGTSESNADPTWWAPEKRWDWILPNSFPSQIAESDAGYIAPYSSSIFWNWIAANNAMWTTYFTSGFTSQWTGNGIIFPDPQDLWTSVSQINTGGVGACDASTVWQTVNECTELSFTKFPPITCSEHTTYGAGAPPPDCAGKCSGEIGYGSLLDECGVCMDPGCTNTGPGATFTENPCNGDEYPGNVNEEGTGWNQICADCGGLANGDWFNNQCGDCVAPESFGATACIRHCNGRYYYTDGADSIDQASLISGTTGPQIDTCGVCMYSYGEGAQNPSLQTWSTNTDWQFWGGTGINHGAGFGWNKPCADCALEPGGTALHDRCYQCVGATTGGTYAADTVVPCVTDCAGNWGGTAEFDDCGVCVYDTASGDGTGWNQTCVDCAGEPGGTAYYDNCGVCVGLSTTGPYPAGATAPCIADCAGNWGGALLDTCIGNNATEEEDCVNNGGFWSPLGYDICGNCGKSVTDVTPQAFCNDYLFPGIGVYEETNGWAFYAVYNEDDPTGSDPLDTIHNSFHSSYGGNGATFSGEDTARAAAYDWWENLSNQSYGLPQSPFGDCTCWGGNEDSDCDGNCQYDRSFSYNNSYDDSASQFDDCNVCVRASTYNSGSCADCSGVDNGSAYTDDCGNCVSTPDAGCAKGCDGIWYDDSSQPEYDDCTICTGTFPAGVPTYNDESCYDCGGNVNGNLHINRCGHCGDPSDTGETTYNRCEMACDGTWQTRVYEDDSGIGEDRVFYYQTGYYNPSYPARLDWCDICHFEGSEEPGWDFPDRPEWNENCTDCAGVLNKRQHLLHNQDNEFTATENKCDECVSLDTWSMTSCAPEGTDNCQKRCDGTWSIASGTGTWPPYDTNECPKPIFNDGATADNIDNCGVCGGTGVPFGDTLGADMTYYGCGCEEACRGDVPWQLRTVYEARHKDPIKVVVRYSYITDFIDDALELDIAISYYVKKKCAQFAFELPRIPTNIGVSTIEQLGFITMDPHNIQAKITINPADYGQESPDGGSSPYEITMNSFSQFGQLTPEGEVTVNEIDPNNPPELLDANPNVIGASTTLALINKYTVVPKVHRQLNHAISYLSSTPVPVDYNFYFKTLGSWVEVTYNLINHVAANPLQIAGAQQAVQEIQANISNVAELKELVAKNEQEVLTLAKHSISKIIKDIYNLQGYGPGSYLNGGWEWREFVPIFVKQLIGNGFHRYAAIVSKWASVGFWSPFLSKKILIWGIDINVWGKVIREIGWYGDSPVPFTYTKVHEILVGDYEKNFIDKTMMSSIEIDEYSVGLLEYVNKLKKLNSEDCEWMTPVVDPATNANVSKYNKQMYNFRISKDKMVSESVKVDENVDTGGYRNTSGFYHKDKPEMKKLGMEFKYLGGIKGDITFAGIDLTLTISSVGVLQHLTDMYHNIFLLSKQDLAMKEDIIDIMKNQIEGRAAGLESYNIEEPGYSDMSLVLIELEDRIREIRGLNNIFSYKSVVQHHFVDSYNDILQNNIIATADEMFNHVSIHYLAEPSKAKTNTSAEYYKTEAMVSYDQDADYLRTYTSYMKNMDPNMFKDWSSANVYLGDHRANDEFAQEQILDAFTPEASNIAQNVLRNVIKPMYQGTLSMLGNPNIRPWDVVYIYDDNIAMYGPVEVEQVVNTISVDGGYITTIIPNLLIYDKDSMRAIEQQLMSHIQQFGFKNMAALGAYSLIRLGAARVGWKWVYNTFLKASSEGAGLSVYNATAKLWELSAKQVADGGSRSAFASAKLANKAQTKVIGRLKAKLKSQMALGSSGKLLDDAGNLVVGKEKEVSKLVQQISKLRAKALISKTTIKTTIASFTKRGGLASWGIKAFNYAGWAYLAWEVLSTVWNIMDKTAYYKINVAQLLAGENQFTWVPLTYKGEDYVAGLEGIIGTPRSTSTIIHGELKGKEGRNRAIYILGQMWDA